MAFSEKFLPLKNGDIKYFVVVNQKLVSKFGRSTQRKYTKIYKFKNKLRKTKPPLL